MSLPRAAALTTLLAVSAAGASPLAEQLPAGALLTLETHNAAPAFERIGGLLARALGADPEGEAGQTVQGLQAILADSLGQEAALGVFTVGQGTNFSPEVLGVTRAGDLASEFFGAQLPKGPGARVGAYPLVRAGDVFAGQAGGLVYFSTNKTLLMNYLGRLGGKAAPKLGDSVAYTTPTRTVGNQELSLFLNFSGVAKVIRGQFARFGLPRLLSPVVDAVDTLGQYAAGFTTTAAGLSARSAQVPGVQGKDQPLRRILTHTTDFRVQDVIPADAENVSASACAPEQPAYLARWLTRVDLLEPFGFLTDSQLASYLERSSQYLGDECARVTLAGGSRAGLNTNDPLAALRYAVTYQRVTDRAAAEAQLPEYAASVNAALAGLKGNLGGLFKGLTGSLTPGEQSPAEVAALNSASRSLDDLTNALGRLKMVYGFRGDYLVTAYNEEALRAALAEGPATLGSNDAFRAANLNLTNAAGWSYGRNLPDLSAADFRAALAAATPGGDTDPMLARLSNVFADLINRYDGMTSQRSVRGGVVVGQSSVQYRW